MRAREPRHTVLIRGRMRAGGPLMDVCIRNVSKNGMMLQAPEAPPRGTYVEVRLPEDVIVGQVIWASDRRFGIKTRDRVPIWRLLGKPAPLSEARSGGQRQLAGAGGIALRARGDGARATGRSAEFLFLLLAIAAVAGFFALLGYQALAGLTEQITTHL